MFEIISDEAADVSKKVRVKFLPFPILYKERETRLSTKEICELLKRGEVLKTSQISVKTFFEAFKKVKNSAICITISKKLSGTYQSALIAARMSGKDIKVLDSGSASIGQGLLVEKAVELREKGYEIEKAFEILNKYRERIKVYFTVKDLSYLKRSGRISNIFASLGNFLGINPIMELYLGDAKVLKIKRGYENAVMEIANIVKRKNPEKAISGYICSKNLGEKIALTLKTKAVEVCPALAAHVGPAVVVGVVE